METMILALRLLMRRAWRGLNGFLVRSQLATMPPVVTVTVMLAAGLMIPMALGIDTTPAGLQRTLAVQRLEQFQRGANAMPETSPAGETNCSAPAFYWPAHEDAAHYNFKLRSGGELLNSTRVVGRAHYLLPAPGELTAGRYRFIVEAIDKDGRSLGQVVDATFVLTAQQEIEGIRKLEADEAALVMAGIYASQHSLHDVRSALTRYLALSPEGKDAPRAKAILGQR